MFLNVGFSFVSTIALMRSCLISAAVFKAPTYSETFSSLKGGMSYGVFHSEIHVLLVKVEAAKRALAMIVVIGGVDCFILKSFFLFYALNDIIAAKFPSTKFALQGEWRF